MRKKDEMEQNIANKSIKITWFVTVMALFIIGGIQSFNNNGERNLLLILAGFSAIFPIILERYFLAKVNEDKTFIKFVGLTLAFLIVLLGIVWFSS